ncbi:acyl carrier protein [Nitrosospira briensis]|uniref:acyl carrier protein n=1 Tax=Nitrosospira briensis TaxID=35799 RepID=UPI0008E895E5|nr:acyl carrier protein [Nitrosospira briensis]SFO29845.1 acyl carrier protein [Nitrosospira briensis]
MSDIENRTRDVMMKVLQIAPQDISPDISRKNRPAWDSLKHMNLMLALEDEFGIEFSDKEIVELNSLHLLVDALRTKRS